VLVSDGRRLGGEGSPLPCLANAQDLRHYVLSFIPSIPINQQAFPTVEIAA